ncbi:hypothetical protein, conserved [Babesia bigemina]|uniref:FYVE-type domain-containing protein n=1 Tax=Babesia bigemina TaxID=5866 RepID=A0A061DEY8_BABBI|nr:hypothetical protein, conserved [Babesia bigemina]CDR98105.1 hypothetical protein, conserved [Babesia bigemina]|eukprot:XP_012770291.1 hypothetical protein, conserved [Babesia bigemina]
MLKYVIFDNLTDEFVYLRASQRARSPPRKQRVKRAIQQRKYEDVRSLLRLVAISESASTCAVCNASFPLSSDATSHFACQLCNETCCINCKRDVLLQGTEHEAPLDAIMCKFCSEYVMKLQSSVTQQPVEETFRRLINSFTYTLQLYKNIDASLLQLQGYTKLCALHQRLKEPLPDGTKEKIHKLIDGVLSQRKEIDGIKNGVDRHSLERTTTNLQQSRASRVHAGIKRSLLALSRGVLYKTVPRISEVVGNLMQYD